MSQWVFVFGALSILVIVLDLLRRTVLREKYAVVWFLTAALFIFFAVFPDAATKVSSFLGFETPSNFVFSLIIILLLGVSMQLSLEVGKLEDRSQTLAEEIAILKSKYD